jgi:hypothetical protein
LTWLGTSPASTGTVTSTSFCISLYIIKRIQYTGDSVQHRI